MARLLRIAPEFPVSNLKNAFDEYAKLGFRVAMEMPEHGYAIIERDGIAIHLFQDKTPHNSPISIHIFATDLDELFEEFQQRGTTFSQPVQRKPWGTRDFRLKDAFGNKLKFTEFL
ncbi:MAG TPA: VOC family protein [Terracidiphilus sp.]|nr:VOC family protein [Terracidiphilus sp.]